MITDGVAATDTSGDGPHRMGQRHEAPLIIVILSAAPAPAAAATPVR